MIADFYTKPLQGVLFRKTRGVVMGLTPFPGEERFEINENRAIISTENMRQKSVSKAMYADTVHNQRDMNDSQLTRIRGAHRTLGAHRSLKVLYFF